MSIKRKNNLLPEVNNKKQRKVIDLELKMKIINAHEAEERVRVIASQFGLAHSTISTILKDKERIKEAAKTARGLRFTILRKRKGLIHKMETLLAIWYDDQVQKGNSVSLLTIQKKARSIFETLKKAEGSQCTENFIASNGWLQRFRKRINLNNRNPNRLNPTVNEKSPEEFLKELDSIIANEHYKPEQIFNVVETSLFWKKVPEAHFADKTKLNLEVSTDRVNLMLGGNTVGFKLKPFLINDSKNPSSVTDLIKFQKYVYYREDKNPWMTSALFEDWFFNCFVPVTMQYCVENGIPNKILLLLAQVPWHPPNINELHPNVKVVYLPKKSRKVLEPMYQGATTVFKENYLLSIFAQAIASTKDEETKVRNFWKSYDISQCIKNIASAWDKVSESCMQGIWRNCLLRFVDDFEPFNELGEVELMKKRVVELAKAFGVHVDTKNIDKLVGYHGELELTNEELMELEAQERLLGYETPPVEIHKTFTTKGLGRVFSRLKSIFSELEEMDEDEQRLSRVRRRMTHTLQCYREIYESLKNGNSLKIKSEPVETSPVSSEVPDPESSKLPSNSIKSENDS